MKRLLLSLLLYCCIVILLGICGVSSALAQDDSNTIATKQLWLDYYQYFYFKPNWQFYGDAGYRTQLDTLEWMEIFARPSILWFAGKHYAFSGGVGFFYTFNHDTVNNFELRPWQGYKLMWPTFKHIKFSHYFRLEERFNFPVDTWDVEFNLRFRYRFGLKSTIYSWHVMQYLFLTASVEFFANVGPQLTEKYSNRSRWGAGLGYRLNNYWDFEFHYVLQRSRTGDNDDFKTTDHLIQLKARHYLIHKDFKNKKHPEDY